MRQRVTALGYEFYDHGYNDAGLTLANGQSANMNFNMSHFPNWKVEGADGPYRVTPNLMVVIPTSEDVRLYYGWIGIDYLAWALTFLGLACLVVIWRRSPVVMPAGPVAVWHRPKVPTPAPVEMPVPHDVVALEPDRALDDPDADLEPDRAVEPDRALDDPDADLEPDPDPDDPDADEP